MKFFITLLLSLALVPTFAETVKPGKYLGAQTSEAPSWFKESFLEFEEDVRDAADAGRRIMLYFHQTGCPYCARLVEENFNDPETVEYVRQHFDGIAINMWGDREVVTVGGRAFTEKTFSEALKVQYTPTVLFLNEQGKVILRLNGYYPPQKFKQALRYAAQKMERKTSFSEFMLADNKGQQGKLMDEDFFIQSADLPSLVGKAERPLALFFESPACADCKTMHQKILTDAATRALVKKMNNVQLNVYSDKPVTLVDGRRLTQKQLATELNISYTPSVVFYDVQGREVHRIEGFLKTFHFQSAFDYVLEKAYLTQPNFQRYLSSRGERLREQGFNTDIWGYKSAYPATSAQ
jgi:thioredoxin-related protein